MDGAVDGIGYIGSQWRNPNGNANVTYLNDVGGEWNSNFNWSENDFNENCRWAVVSKPFHFLPFRQVFYSSVFPGDHNPLIHPPSIFPISFKCSESVIYFLLSSTLNSHPTWRKNFSESSLMLAFCR